MNRFIHFFFIMISISVSQSGWMTQRISNGLHGIKNTITANPSKQILLGGGVCAILATQMDGDVQDWFLENQPLPESINHFGDLYGNLYSGFIILSVAGVSAIQSKSLNKFEYAFATIGANGVTTVLLKEMVGRERPNGANHRSFPSGHTSHSFATATIFKESFGWKLGAPAYCLATITAMNRIQDNKHYLSDVVFGASLGTAFGMGFSKVYLNDSKQVDMAFNPFRSEVQISVLF